MIHLAASVLALDVPVPVESPLGVVPEILGFGLIGLSFLLAFLGYRLLNKVAEAETPDREMLRTTRFFLVIAVVLMVGAGALELYRQSKPLDVYFFLSPAELDQVITGVDLAPGVLVGTDPVGLVRGTARLRVFSDSPIQVQLDRLVDHVRRLQSQISVQTDKEARRTDEIGVPDAI